MDHEMGEICKEATIYLKRLRNTTNPVRIVATATLIPSEDLPNSSLNCLREANLFRDIRI